MPPDDDCGPPDQHPRVRCGIVGRCDSIGFPSLLAAWRMVQSHVRLKEVIVDMQPSCCFKITCRRMGTDCKRLMSLIDAERLSVELVG